MGAEDIGFCIALHERLERAEAPITRRINGVVFQALGAERYDDRLLVFARHQLMVNERRRELAAYDLDDETLDLLQSLVAAHERHGVWCERRAQAFAATRQMEFRGGAVGVNSGPGFNAAAVSAEPTPSRADPALAAEEGATYADTLDDERAEFTDGSRREPDGQQPGEEPERLDAPRSAAPRRRQPRAPYTPGYVPPAAPLHDATSYAVPPRGADRDDFPPPANLPVDAYEQPDAQPYPPAAPPAPVAPPRVRRRAAPSRPGSARQPNDAASGTPSDATPTSAAPYPAEGDYPHDSTVAPGYAGYAGSTPYPDEPNGDD